MNQEIPIFKFAVRENLDKLAFLPTRATPRATGWDVKCAISGEGLIIHPGEHVKIPLGFRTFCPEGWWFELKPRSSTFGKKKLHCLYGTVDEDYEGELIFACQYIPDLEFITQLKINKFENPDGYYKEESFMTNLNAEDLVIKFGEAIGQIIPIKRQEMIVEGISNQEIDNLYAKRNSDRGAGGFGSTDKK